MHSIGRVLDLEADAVAAVLAERDLDLPGRAAEGADLLLGELHARGQERLAGVALGPGVLDPLEPAALALPGPDRIAEELELRRLLEVGDGEDVLQRGLEAGVLALLGEELHLEELGVGLRLDVQKVGHREDRLDLREVDPLAVRISRFFGHVVSLSSRDRVSPFPGPDERTLSQPGHLLKLDDGSDFGELGLDGLGLFLGHAFLERLGGAVDEVLGFLEPEAGDFADDLDDVDLLVARRSSG